MADAIDNLAQALNQANAVDEFPGYPGYQLGQEVPNTGGVKVGDLFYGYDPYGQEAPYNWRTGAFEFQAAPSDVGFENIDYNIRDQPTERINIGNTDEQDALIRTGIGTPLDPKTEDIYGVKGLVPPDKAGGFVGVEYLTPKQIEDLTAGQTPSVPQGVETPGKTVSIPGRGLPNYRQIVDSDGNINFLNEDTRKIDFTLPGVKGVVDLTKLPEGFPLNIISTPNLSVPSTLTKGTNAPFTPSPVESSEPTTTSVGGFDNTGGNVTASPGVAGPGVDDTIRFNPDYKPKPEPKPGDEFKDSPWEVFDPTGKGKDDSDYRDPKTGELFGTDQEGYKWNYRTQQFDCVGGRCSEKPPVKDTGTTPAPPAGGGTGTTPPPGGGTPGGGTPPGGGGIPSGGGQPGRGPTIIPPREPVTPLIRRETVIPTKGTKEVPLPDRQADPFAKLYADLLANSQQQQDQYRYINYDPDQIMNAAMSGFRRRGAMRSLQGY
jgi:hypothetical protein